MIATDLRLRYPKFIYDSFSTEIKQGILEIKYDFLIAPDIQFFPTVSIPLFQEVILDATIENLVFHLGLVEMISYWKCTASPTISINAGSLTHKQRDWWRNVLIQSLGEFFYTNRIHFNTPTFLSIQSNEATPGNLTKEHKNYEGNLIPVGGGKDSAVTLELVKNMTSKSNVLLLSPTPAAEAVTRSAGFDDPIVVERTIDPLLIKLNDEGFLNGHTPFSAYLSFLGVLVSHLYKFKHIVVSNEQSANEGNVSYDGMEINHQYSKSFHYEQAFQSYGKEYLSTEIDYFSFLRPLTELQIAFLFSRLPTYFNYFISCNVDRGKSWCGRCAKCAFTYLILYPFLSKESRLNIFHSDFFEKHVIKDYIEKLVGLKNSKPFECVGTADESQAALILVIQKMKEKHIPIPTFITSIAKKIGDKYSVKHIQTSVRTDWNQEHRLPPEFERILREQMILL